MKKVLLAAVALGFSLPFASAALAQEVTYRTEVCVNASNAAEAKRLFPKATLHIIPDDSDSSMHGWRIVVGSGRFMTDAEEIALRQQQSLREARSE
jgi:hypothetical protein